MLLCLIVAAGCQQKGRSLGPEPVVLFEGARDLTGVHRNHFLIADDANVHVQLRANANVEVLLFDHAITLEDEASVAAEEAECTFSGASFDGDCRIDAGSLGVLVRRDGEPAEYQLTLSAVARP